MMARQKKAEPKPDMQEVKKEVIRAYEDAENRHNIAFMRNLEKLPENYMINMRSAYSHNHCLPLITKETIDGFKVHHSLYLTKPLFKKLKLLSQLRDEPFITCLVDLAQQQIDALLENDPEIASLVRKRILEEAYGLGKESPVVREEKLKQAIIDEDPEKHK